MRYWKTRVIGFAIGFTIGFGIVIICSFIIRFFTASQAAIPTQQTMVRSKETTEITHNCFVQPEEIIYALKSEEVNIR
ncbi:MAG: hypothetical protein AB1489_09315, partial [Acidobacteriota bacterium]